jgi:hypothetical protein
MDLAEMRMVKEVMGSLRQGYLRRIFDALSLDEKEVKSGLWRWRFKFPGWLNVKRREMRKDLVRYLCEKRGLREDTWHIENHI